MGDVRLWGMGAEQVASILRQAGQESIRLVVARPIDPTVPNYLVRKFSIVTKKLGLMGLYHSCLDFAIDSKGLLWVRYEKA